MDSGKKKFDPRSIDEKVYWILSPGKGRYDRTPLQRVYPLSRRIRQRRLPGVAKLRSLPPGKSTLTGHPS
ncbi:hypothetical protein NXV02_22440 [Bacteroides ovatus]|nr:hypothetical protein [Bacteroides ovatus]MCS2815332.1 hypothetical protein [Bacteroides ovatus]